MSAGAGRVERKEKQGDSTDVQKLSGEPWNPTFQIQARNTLSDLSEEPSSAGEGVGGELTGTHSHGRLSLGPLGSCSGCPRCPPRRS